MAQAQVSLDEGIEYLQRFLALLATTSSGLQKAAGTFAEQRGVLQQLGEEATAHGDGLESRLQEALQQLDTAAALVEEGERLAEVAVRLDEEQLASGRARLETAAAECERQVESSTAAVAKELGELGETGFAALGSRLGEAEGALEASASALDTASAELGAQVADLAAQAATAAGETLQAFADMQQELGAARQAVEEGGAELAALWDQLGGSVATRAAEVGEQVAALYASWLDEIAAQGEELQQGVVEATQETASLLAEDTAPTLAQAVEAATEGAFSALLAELQEAAAVAAEGGQASDEVSSMVEELVVARRVVTHVDELLDAMQVE